MNEQSVNWPKFKHLNLLLYPNITFICFFCKKKEQVSHIIQRWWRALYQRKQFQKDLRISSDNDNRIIATTL